MSWFKHIWKNSRKKFQSVDVEFTICKSSNYSATPVACNSHIELFAAIYLLLPVTVSRGDSEISLSLLRLSQQFVVAPGLLN